MAAKRKSTAVAAPAKPRGTRKTNRARRTFPKPKKLGRPSRYTVQVGLDLCRLIAAGMTAKDACAKLGVLESTFYYWLLDHPEFNDAYERARDIRANAAFTEQQLQIADNVADDWSYNPGSGKLSVNKEAMLRSKIRIETRQWQMARRPPQEWGDRQQIDVKNDMTQLTVEERLRKAAELLDLVRVITGPRPTPPPLEYRPEESEDEEPGGIGS